MNTQINLKVSGHILARAKKYAKQHGFENLQELLRSLLREKLFETELVSGKLTYKASEASLARNWRTVTEDKAWAHLQKET